MTTWASLDQFIARRGNHHDHNILVFLILCLKVKTSWSLRYLDDQISANESSIKQVKIPSTFLSSDNNTIISYRFKDQTISSFFLYYLLPLEWFSFQPYNMKSPLYMLAVLLPLVAAATPIADPEADIEDLEERDGGRNGGGRDRDECKVRRSYPYYKYPCNSSPKIAFSQVGATFTSSCRYQWVLSDIIKMEKAWWTLYRNGDSGVWYQTPRGWVKDQDKPRGCRMWPFSLSSSSRKESCWTIF